MKKCGAGSYHHQKRLSKTSAELRKEREKKVKWLIRDGYLRSERIRNAMLKVRREDFIPIDYKDYAYREVPLPLPGTEATISCPHSYPLFMSPWVWIKAISSSRSVLDQVMARRLPEKLLAQMVWLYALKSTH